MFLLSAGVVFGAIQSASALELDWNGQFRSEFDFVKTYTLDGNATGIDPARFPVAPVAGVPAPQGAVAGTHQAQGYYNPYGGSNNAQFETLFMKLQPKLIVNDNISIKSEWWLGNPVYGFYGDSSPDFSDQKQYYSTNSGGSVITAQRFWAEFLTDFGTIKLGRAPLNYGLGLIWNSGDGIWDRYESTGDIVQLVSKFGAFSFIPTIVSYSTGNNVGGNFQGPTSIGGVAPGPMGGAGGLNDYSIQVKYDNLDEDFYAGLNFIRRISGSSQDSVSGYFWNGQAGLNYNTYDVYFRKKIGKFDLSAEIPIANGTVGGTQYSTWAFAAEGDWRVNDPWEFLLKVGRAPGQPDDPSQIPGSYKGFYFNQDYKIALIMFNYAFQNFAGPNNQNNQNVQSNQLESPYDNPIFNATYVALRPTLHADKWKFHANYVYARANQTATPGQFYWNGNHRQMENNNAGESQSSSMGWEMDYGADFQYDQYFQFGLEVGWWFPGAYYGFSNVAGDDNATNGVMAASARVGISF